MEQIACGFLKAWVPATGLSPIINIWEKNGTKRVTDWPLQEIAGGFYVYNFNEYSPDKFYLYLVDGTSSLADSDRYIMGNNELDAYSNKNTRGRTVAATVSYKPDFDKIHAWMQTLQSAKPVDISQVTKELGNIKKFLTSDKWTKEMKTHFKELETKLLWELNNSKEQLVSHTKWLSDMSNMTIKEMIDSILTEYKSSHSTQFEAINGLWLDLKWKLDTLSSRDDLSATGDRINSSVQEVIYAMASNYIKENFVNMFDLSIKRKWQEVSVDEGKTDEEDILAQLTK